MSSRLNMYVITNVLCRILVLILRAFLVFHKRAQEISKDIRVEVKIGGHRSIKDIHRIHPNRTRRN